eukprot:754743-Hanusia_phi.AAC.2
MNFSPGLVLLLLALASLLSFLFRLFASTSKPLPLSKQLRANWAQHALLLVPALLLAAIDPFLSSCLALLLFSYHCLQLDQLTAEQVNVHSRDLIQVKPCRFLLFLPSSSFSGTRAPISPSLPSFLLPPIPIVLCPYFSSDPFLPPRLTSALRPEVTFSSLCCCSQQSVGAHPSSRKCSPPSRLRLSVSPALPSSS